MRLAEGAERFPEGAALRFVAHRLGLLDEGVDVLLLRLEDGRHRLGDPGRLRLVSHLREAVERDSKTRAPAELVSHGLEHTIGLSALASTCSGTLAVTGTCAGERRNAAGDLAVGSGDAAHRRELRRSVLQPLGLHVRDGTPAQSAVVVKHAEEKVDLAFNGRVFGSHEAYVGELGFEESLVGLAERDEEPDLLQDAHEEEKGRAWLDERLRVLRHRGCRGRCGRRDRRECERDRDRECDCGSHPWLRLRS